MAQLTTDEIAFESLTDVGRVRKTNQDAAGSVLSAHGGLLLVVADGMGGHQGGETASRIAIESILEVVKNSPDDPEDTLKLAVEEANKRIYARGQSDDALKGMGTTVVALFFQPDSSVWVANVGDSRAYRYRGSKLERLTSDHSVVAEMLRQGNLTEDEAFVHPARNQLLRAVGIEEQVAVDISREEVLPADVYLLCSDGLHGLLRDAELLQILKQKSEEKPSARLLQAANARGGSDNISVQVARIPGAGSGAPGIGSSFRSLGLTTPWKRAGAIFLGAILLAGGLIFWASL